jgi:hypothetical protein
MEKLVRRIGLVAHDAMKKDLIEWVLWNSIDLGGSKSKTSRCEMGFYDLEIRSARR